MRSLNYAVIGLAAISAFANDVFSQASYDYVSEYSGVEFYSRWKKDPYTNDSHLNVKVINTSQETKRISFAIQWLDREGRFIEKSTNTGFTIRPGQTKAGDLDGLYWYVPKGYSSHNVEAKLVDIEIR